MTNKVELNTLTQVVHKEQAFLTALNENFLRLQQAINDTLSRSGVVPNQMEEVLDMNGKRVINVGAAVEDTDALTRGFIQGLIADVEAAVARLNTLVEEAKQALEVYAAEYILPPAIAARDAAKDYYDDTKALYDALKPLVDDLADLNTLISKLPELLSVYNDLTNIDTVAGLSSDISTVVTNIQAILDAPTYAANAAASAELSAQYANDKINQTHISNCITYIPQDIKLSVSGTTITLGSSSVLTNTDGTQISTTQAKTQTPTADGVYVLFPDSNGNFVLVLKTNCVSGTTDSKAGTAYHIWYDTTNNVINYYTDTSTTPAGTRFLPLGIVTVSSSVTSVKIDTVFNGFGYIGTMFYALPGVNGLAPNGRNADGTLKSVVLSSNGLCINNATNNGTWQIRLRNNWIGLSTFIYKEDVNYNYNGSVAPGNERTEILAGEITRVNGVIIDFSPKTVFHSVDYYDYKSVVATGTTKSRTLSDRFADVVNVKDFGAVGDLTTDDSAAFTAVEALSAEKVYVPAGAYRLGSMTVSNMTKNYFGPGEIIFGNKSSHKVLVQQQNPMVDAAVPILTGGRSVVFIGDSITSGFGNPAGPTVSYVDMLQKMIAKRSNSCTCDRASFCNLDYETRTGTTSVGTAGPVHRSRILAPGATLSFKAQYVDVFHIYYMKTNTTTTVTLNCSEPNKTFTFTTETGNSIGRLEGDSWFRSKPGATFTITNTGSENLELTGMGLYHDTASGTIYFHNFSVPGYTTTDYASNDVLNAIKSQTFNGGWAPIYVIELGTNDCYGSLNTPAQFKANLDFIVAGLLQRSPTAGIALCQPWVKDGYGANKGTPQEYRDALEAVAIKYGCSIFDGAELDLNRYNSTLRADNLHPSPEGYKLLADWFWKKLGLDGWHQDEMQTGPTMEDGISGSSFRAIMRNKHVYLEGHIDLGSSMNLPSDTLLFTVPLRFAPRTQRYLVVGTNSSVGSIVLYIGTDGKVTNGAKTATNIRFIFPEGLSWSLER